MKDRKPPKFKQSRHGFILARDWLAENAPEQFDAVMRNDGWTVIETANFLYEKQNET